MIAAPWTSPVFLSPTINLERITEILDGLGHEGRVHTTHTWGKAEMEKVFDAAKGYKPVDVDFFVPVSEPLVEVQHDLHNTVPLPGTEGQKRFARSTADANVLIGFNPQPMNAFSGPGYFTATKGEGDHAGELVVDYTKIPTEKVASWPAIRDNGGFIPGIVYGGMTDYVRAISSHVSIGKAFKGGQSRDAFFTIVRRDLDAAT